jgi:hypothetical protein
MLRRLIAVLSAAAAVGFAGGCTSISGTGTQAMTMPDAVRIDVCSGYSCRYRTRLDLGPSDHRRFAAIMARGASSPKAERAAISKAVRYYEERIYEVTGVRDEPKSRLGASGERGQMDCIDESTNTHALLKYLAARKLLKHHTVERNASRGFFFDGRYPHSTAVIGETGGVEWAVDSWYAPMGGAPDIIPLSEWLPRGVLSSGALDQPS